MIKDRLVPKCTADATFDPGDDVKQWSVHWTMLSPWYQFGYQFLAENPPILLTTRQTEHILSYRALKAVTRYFFWVFISGNKISEFWDFLQIPISFLLYRKIKIENHDFFVTWRLIWVHNFQDMGDGTLFCSNDLRRL